MNMWHLAFVGAETLDIPSAPPLPSHAAALNWEAMPKSYSFQQSPAAILLKRSINNIIRLGEAAYA